MRIIGITGGVGSGKSAILDRIKEIYNCKVISADRVAHLVKELGTPCYEQLIDLLGQRVLDTDNRINKAKMAEIIFADAELLEQTNRIIHPAVKDFIEAEIASEKEKNQIDLLFIEAALLIEDGYGKIVDELWYIYADEEVRLKRLKESRGYSDEKIRQIIKSQLSDHEFREKCHFTIDNSHDLETAIQQIPLLGGVPRSGGVVNPPIAHKE